MIVKGCDYIQYIFIHKYSRDDTLTNLNMHLHHLVEIHTDPPPSLSQAVKPNYWISL